MATTSTNNIARAIYQATKGKAGTSLMDATHDVVKFLDRKRLLGRSKEILASLERIVNKEESIAKVILSSANKISASGIKDIEKFVKDKYGSKSVMIEEKIDEKLIGGVRIEVNNEVIDLTTKYKLGKLQEYLTHS